jgi:hypothetical protein
MYYIFQNTESHVNFTQIPVVITHSNCKHFWSVRKSKMTIFDSHILESYPIFLKTDIDTKKDHKKKENYIS